MPKHKAAIFVNRCFWHMHENCKYSSIPKNNHEFWKDKLEGNVERDKKNYAKLESMGIKVIMVLGYEIKQMMKDEIKIENLLHTILL